MHTQQRGQLTLPSGEIYLLDHLAQLRLGVQAVATLPLNAVPAARPVIVRTPTAPLVARRPTGGRSPIAQFNQDHDPLAMMEDDGAYRPKASMSPGRSRLAVSGRRWSAASKPKMRSAMKPAGRPAFIARLCIAGARPI